MSSSQRQAQVCRPDLDWEGFFSQEIRWTGHSKAKFVVQADVKSYLRDYYRDTDLPHHLGGVLTLTGQANEALATTCQDYMDLNWQSSGRGMVKAIQHCLDQTTYHRPGCAKRSVEPGKFR